MMCFEIGPIVTKSTGHLAYLIVNGFN